MKGRRYPYRLRSDGKPKGMHLHRSGVATLGLWVWFYVLDQSAPPSANSAERTRSARALAGSRRAKRLMRGAR